MVVSLLALGLGFLGAEAHDRTLAAICLLFVASYLLIPAYFVSVGECSLAIHRANCFPSPPLPNQTLDTDQRAVRRGPTQFELPGLRGDWATVQTPTLVHGNARLGGEEGWVEGKRAIPLAVVDRVGFSLLLLETSPPAPRTPQQQAALRHHRRRLPVARWLLTGVATFLLFYLLPTTLFGMLILAKAGPERYSYCLLGRHFTAVGWALIAAQVCHYTRPGLDILLEVWMDHRLRRRYAAALFIVGLPAIVAVRAVGRLLPRRPSTTPSASTTSSSSQPQYRIHQRHSGGGHTWRPAIPRSASATSSTASTRGRAATRGRHQTRCAW